MGPHFMLLLSIYVLYSNVTDIYSVSSLVEIKLFQIVSCVITTLALHSIQERNCILFRVFLHSKLSTLDSVLLCNSEIPLRILIL